MTIILPQVNSLYHSLMSLVIDTRTRTITYGSGKTKEVKEKFPILEQMPIRKQEMLDKNNPALSLLSSAVPRLRCVTGSGSGLHNGSGSACAITPTLFLTAEHCIDPQEGDRYFLDFPMPDTSRRSSKSRQEEGGEYTLPTYDKDSGLTSLSVPVEVLAKEKETDLALLGLAPSVRKLNLPFHPRIKEDSNLPYLRIAPHAYCHPITVKAGHYHGSLPLQVTQGEVLINRVDDLDLTHVEDFIESVIKSRGANISDVISAHGLDQNEIVAFFSGLSQNSVDETFRGKIIATNLCNGGDSGGALINNNGELQGVTTNGILSGRFPFRHANPGVIASLLAIYGLRVVPKLLPVNSISAYAGVEDVHRFLDSTLGRKNLYRLVDGEASDVRITREEALVNHAASKATFLVQQALKESGQSGSTKVQLASGDKKRTVVCEKTPLDMDEVGKRAREAKPHWSSKRLPESKIKIPELTGLSGLTKSTTSRSTSAGKLSQIVRKVTKDTRGKNTEIALLRPYKI